jgi:hypothetical protein
MSNDLGRCFKAVFGKWKSGMYGGFALAFTIVALILAILGLSIEPLKAVPIATMGLVFCFLFIAAFCWFFAVFDAWREMDRQMRTNFVFERNRQAREWLGKLSDGQKAGLRDLLVVHRLHGDQIRERHPGTDFTIIDDVTTFLDHTYDDFWSIHATWEPILGALLSKERTTKTTRQHLAYLILELRSLKRAFLREKFQKS